MKTLYVTIPEWMDVIESAKINRGSFGGFQSDEEATRGAIEKVLGPEVAAQCVGSVRVEIVTELAPYARFVTDEEPKL
jgi:hypothetical protein